MCQEGRAGPKPWTLFQRSCLGWGPRKVEGGGSLGLTGGTQWV